MLCVCVCVLVYRNILKLMTCLIPDTQYIS
jgi:hypothetical protein